MKDDDAAFLGPAFGAPHAVRANAHARTHGAGSGERDVPPERPGIVVVQALDAGRLRNALRDRVRDRSACWLSMDGASLGDADAHRGFVHHAAAGGVVPGVPDAAVPNAVVFDWSRAACPAAEAAACFSLLLDGCGSAGVARYVVLPERVDASAVIEAVCSARPGCVVHVTPPPGRPACRLLAATGAAACDDRATAATFLERLSAAMADVVAEPVRRIVMSLAHDMLANVVEHAAASRMSAVAVLLARRRPPLIQIGVADDGRGIPSAMLDRGDYRGFGLLHDASVVHAVLARGLTRRVGGAGEDGDDGRGGLSAMIAALMPLLAAVRVRSGAALVSATARSGWRRSALDHGHGSQMVVEVPLTA